MNSDVVLCRFHVVFEVTDGWYMCFDTYIVETSYGLTLVLYK